MAEESLIAKGDIADNRKFNLEYMEENINNEMACVVKEPDIENNRDSTISVKEEAIEELELDIKEGLVQPKLELADNDAIDTPVDESEYFVDPNDLRSDVKAEENILLENPSTTQCAIKSTAPKDFFTSCNDCLKAFYQGFTYDKILKPKMGKTIHWKCSEANRGCCAEICVFVHSKFFMELEDHHTCTPQEENSPLVFNELFFTEQRCTSFQLRTIYRHEVLTRYVPLKKVVSYWDRKKIIDPTEPTTIAFYFLGERNTVAFYMGHEYKVKKISSHWCLNCAHASCPGLMRVLRPNTAIAKITDHTCNRNTDSIDVNVPQDVPFPDVSKLLHYTDEVFGDPPPDITDDTLAYYCKFISGYRRTVVLYRRHNYLYSAWTKENNVWKCEHPSCRATLNVIKNKKAVSLVGDHSCDNSDPSNLEVKTLPSMDPNHTGQTGYYYKEVGGYRGRVILYMGFKYGSRRWNKLYSSWTCLVESCSATLQIRNETKGIMAVSQHTCDQLELGNVTQTEVSNTAGPVKLEATSREKRHLKKILSKSFVHMEADDQQYIYTFGHLYKFTLGNDDLLPCIHRDTFGCRAQLKYGFESHLILPASGHDCFRKSRNVDNLMFFQGHLSSENYAYFSGYVYRRSRMVYDLFQVYKWVCVTTGCKGVLTTKFDEVVAESAHGCRMDEENRVEADSDEGSAQKKIKTE